jgi:GT2 family glycosyltransferase
MTDDPHVDLTVITATWHRPQLLVLCLAQFAQQSVGNLRCEHVVVSDGRDDRARRFAENAGARYIERPQTGGVWGAFAKNDGIAAAAGDYLCFWDDDNLYYPHALATLYGAAVGFDIGVVQTLHRDPHGERPIPSWSGTFEPGNIDSMCFCVRREIARSQAWGVFHEVHRGDDHRWISRLHQSGARVRFVPIVIGEHIEA